MSIDYEILSYEKTYDNWREYKPLKRMGKGSFVRSFSTHSQKDKAKIETTLKEIIKNTDRVFFDEIYNFILKKMNDTIHQTLAFKAIDDLYDEIMK